MSDPITRLNAALEGRYRIERELGEGGMATIYLADDLRHERKVALKALRPAVGNPGSQTKEVVMRTVILALTFVLTLGVGVASAQSIEGVWRLAEYEGENVRPADPVGLMIVADGHYSRVFVRSEQPRQPVGNGSVAIFV